MEYITTKEAASKWNITSRSVIRYAQSGRIPGAKLVGKTWFLPTTAIRPIDARYKNSNILKGTNKNKRFIFPIIPFSSYIHSAEYFDEEENALYEAQLNFYRCNYLESYTALSALIKTCKNIYVRLGCYYTLSELSVLFGHRKTFSLYRNEFHKLYQKDFPYKEEIRILLISLDNYDAYHENTHTKYIELLKHQNYDSHVFPFFYSTYMFVLMSDYILKHRVADLEGIEIVALQMQSENIPLALQSMHVYMSVMYQLSGKQKEANEHLTKAFDIAFQTGFYHSIVLSSQFIAYSMNKLINNYDPSVKEFIEKKKEYVVNNYIGGRLAISMFKNEKSGYYLELAMYVINGFTNKEIAQIMNISEIKVRNRISHIYEIVGVTSRKELNEYALRLLKTSGTHNNEY